MARFTPLDPATLTDAQRAVVDEVRAGRRGTVPANVVAWLPNPELARRAAALGELVRYESALPPRLSELAILVVARHWHCAYEWAVHVAEATRAGVAPAAIDAIATGRHPDGLAEDERIVYRLAAALLARGAVDDALYEDAQRALGDVAMGDLAAIVGYYTLVAFTLNLRDVPVPDGAARLPERG